MGNGICIGICICGGGMPIAECIGMGTVWCICVGAAAAA
jgi:hypothetical protein